MPRPQLILSPEARKIALEKASEAKAAKKVLLEKIRAGELTLSDILSEEAKTDERIQMLQVTTLLRALPGVPASRVDGILKQVGIDEGRRVRGLGARQKAALLTWRGQ